MSFLLFFLWISFFFIFFLFSWIEISWALFPSIFLEANLYIAASILFIFASFTRQTRIQEASKIKELFSFNIRDFIKYFFRDIVYYISIILFYWAFFLIFRELFWEIYLPQIFLFFNIIVIFLFFLWEKKITIFWDLLRVNTSIISLYYIFYHLIFIFGGNILLSIYDIMNVICIFFLMYLFLYNSPKENYKNIFYVYIYSFVFLELCVLLKIFFEHNVFSFSLLAFTFWISLSSFSKVLKQRLKIPIFITRFFGVIFLSMHVILVSLLVLNENIFSFLTLMLLPMSVYLLWLYHVYFENYMALFFSSLWIVTFFTGIYLLFLWEELQFNYFYILYFFLSVWFLFAHKILKKRKEYDKYFFHIFSFIVNLLCVFLFFFFVDFSILGTGLFLLAESVYFSASYYSLKKENYDTLSS